MARDRVGNRPQQSVVVSAHLIPFETVLAVAERLEVVDEATWTTATL